MYFTIVCLSQIAILLLFPNKSNLLVKQLTILFLKSTLFGNQKWDPERKAPTTPRLVSKQVQTLTEPIERSAFLTTLKFESELSRIQALLSLHLELLLFVIFNYFCFYEVIALPGEYSFAFYFCFCSSKPLDKSLIPFKRKTM